MRRCGFVGLVVALLVLAACGGGGGTAAAPSTTVSPAPARTVTVAAAASLSGVYQQLAGRFRATHPGTDVRFDFANSAQLAQQVVSGAPVDVFAAASPDTMNTVVRAGLTAGDPVVTATNTLSIAVAPGDPRAIRGFTSLADPSLRVVTTAAQTPCGMATAEVARRTNTVLHPVSEQGDVTAATQAVVSGNADAAVVFVTDVAAARGRVDGVAVPESAAVPVRYPVVALRTAPAPDLARDWVGLVTGPDGVAAFTAAGFGRP